jgi:hypothetical protein
MYHSSTLTASLCLLLLTGAAAPLVAQGQAAEPASRLADEAEAEQLLRAMRAEQTRFERIRRNNLPWTHSRGGGCDPGWGDERIGRFCLMHGDDGKEYEPPPEAAAIVEARAHLLSRLGEAAERAPWDGWIVGQRVRYMLESGDAESAAIIAHDCAAAEWWCAAITGFVHHYSGNPARADSAYSEAIRLMPDAERDRWLDLSTVLEGRTLRAYRRLEGEERDRFHERFWKLSRLHFARPGNDLRSEHLSRNVLDVFQDRAQSADGISWGEDLREILIRYGWPTGWERVRETSIHRPGGPPSLVSHYANSRTQILPPHEILFPDQGTGFTQGSWDVESRRPRTGYNLPMPLASARWIRAIDHQFAVFRRPGGALIVAAYEIPADSMPDAGDQLASALAVAGRDADARVTEFPNRGLSDVVLAEAEPGPALLSLEIFSMEAGRAARVRRGVEIIALQPGVLALSDILLLREADPLPDSLADAAPLARGSDRVRPGERLGVYWEVYGLSEEEIETLAVSVRLVDRRGGWLRRAAERMGVVSESAPIRLRWQEQASSAAFIARSVAIEIPRVTPGGYVLELSVQRAGEEAVTTERAIEVIGS